MQNEAPRLKERSLIARVAFCFLCLGCVSTVVVAFYSVWQAFVPDPVPAQPVAGTTHHSINVFNNGAALHAAHRKPPIQRSVVQRLAMLRRAQGARGIDVEWAKQVFPHWFQNDSDNFDVQATLSDLALALAYLSHAELED